MIKGCYVREDAETIEEARSLFYGFVRVADYHKQTVVYSIRHFVWFANLTKHTVVAVGRGKFAASDAVLGRILRNHGKDIVTEALENVAMQPDFEQQLNYFSNAEDVNKAMESYIGKMIAYTAIEWVRTLLQEYERNFSIEMITESKGDKIMADIADALGLNEESAKELMHAFEEVEAEEDLYDAYADDVTEETAVVQDEVLVEALNKCVYVDKTGVYRDARFCVLLSFVLFGIMNQLVYVSSDTFCGRLYEWFHNSDCYVAPGDKDLGHATFLGVLQFCMKLSNVYGYELIDIDELSDLLLELRGKCFLKSFVKYGIRVLENDNIKLTDAFSVKFVH